MPNWCECELEIAGDHEKLKRFMTHAVEGAGSREEELARKLHGVSEKILDANQFIPYPEEYRILDDANPFQGKGKPMPEDVKKRLEEKGFDTTRDGFNQGGYGWRVKNWGTKWNFSNVSRNLGDERLNYTFDTAWSPPGPVILKMSEMFPSLTFTLRYVEPGMAFYGTLKAENGEAIEDWCLTIEEEVYEKYRKEDAPLWDLLF